MNKRNSFLFLAVATIVLAGCSVSLKTTKTPAPEADLSSINATLEGTLGAASATGEYSLQTTQGPKLLHDGNAVLAGYVGRNIKVTGQYSGTTLYVDEIEVIQ